MRAAVLIAVAALAAQAKDIRFDGNSGRNNYLRPAPLAKFSIFGHRIDLTSGAVTFVIVDSGAPPVEIVTPRVTEQPFLAGEYKIEVTRFGETHVTPGAAEVRVQSPQGAEWVHPGQKMIVRGAASAPEFRIVSAVSGWQRFFGRLGAAFRSGGVSAGGGSDDTPAESPRRDDSRGKPSEASKPEARTQSPGHPNEGPVSSPHPSRGK
jgi:hypothetical protein